MKNSTNELKSNRCRVLAEKDMMRGFFTVQRAKNCPMTSLLMIPVLRGPASSTLLMATAHG